MSRSHHPERTCLIAADAEPGTLSIVYTFTSGEKTGLPHYKYRYYFPDTASYDEAVEAGTSGTYYNGVLRGNPAITAVRRIDHAWTHPHRARRP